jgi:two-component system, LytTR family, sensor kinase
MADAGNSTPNDEKARDVHVDWRVAAGAAAALMALFTFQNYLTPRVNRGSSSLAVTFALQFIIWGLWLALCPLIFAIARRWRRTGRFTPDVIVQQLFIGFGVSVLHAALAGTIRWITGLSVFEDLAEVIVGSVAASAGTNMLRYWFIASIYHALAYHREVRDRDVRAARLEGSLVQAKLDSLQGRLHPHFLFNTLNSIGALIHDQPAAAEQMLGSLSELLRASLHADPAREVTLERELDLLRQYISIQQMRFQDRLTVDIDIAPGVLDALVPHLLLQPLLENAIRHGIAPREGPGRVRIAAGRHGDHVRLVVEDDGVGLTDGRGAAAGSGFGLSSTRARLEHLYGASASLDVRPRTPTGVTATVDLPHHTSAVMPS